MNWDDLRIFLAVARMGSLSGAARHLKVQHSTVSRRIQHLENSMGVRLLEKKPSGYDLTPAGDDLREAALRMEMEILNVEGTLLDQDEKLTGSLRVTCVGNMASSFLIPLLARFKERYPEINLELFVSNSDVSLSEREADVAIRVTNSPADTLIGKKIATIASTVYAGRNYLDKLRKNNETPKWIGVNCCNYHTKWTKKLSGGESWNFMVNEPIITLESVREGLGLAVLPCHMGDPDPDLVRFMEPAPEMDLDLWALYHTDLKRTKRVRVFREFLVEEFNKISDLLDGSKGDQIFQES